MLQQHQASQHPLAKIEDGEDPEEFDDLDLQRGYSRPRVERRKSILTDEDDDDEELSDYVKVRLALARLKALKKYQEVWG